MIKSAYSSDAMGVLVSVLCLAHCLLLPLLVNALSVAGIGFIASETTHRALVLVLLAVGLLAFIPGYRLHGKLKVVLLAALGLLTLSFAAFMAADQWGERAETWLTVLASAALITAHLKNLSYCRLCLVCEAPKLNTERSSC